MTIHRHLPALLLLLSIAVPGQAEWSGGVEGGTVIQGDSSATRLRLKLNNSSRPLSQSIYADWLSNQSGDDSYELGYKPRYWLGLKLYVFGEARLRVDKPLNIDNETVLQAGVGNQFIATADSALSVDIGVGNRRTKFVNSDADADNTEFVFLSTDFYQDLADLLRFELDADAVQGEEFLETQAEAGIAVRMAGGAIKYSYRVRRIEYDGVPAISDSDSFVSFSYGF